MSDVAGFDRLQGFIGKRCAGGLWTAMQISHNGKPVGGMVISTEADNIGRTLVINALGAKPVAGVDMTAAAVQFARSLAKQIGAKRLRFWTIRPGLVRKVENMGFKRAYVMEADI